MLIFDWIMKKFSVTASNPRLMLLKKLRKRKRSFYIPIKRLNVNGVNSIVSLICWMQISVYWLRSSHINVREISSTDAGISSNTLPLIPYCNPLKYRIMYISSYQRL